MFVSSQYVAPLNRGCVSCFCYIMTVSETCPHVCAYVPVCICRVNSFIQGHLAVNAVSCHTAESKVTNPSLNPLIHPTDTHTLQLQTWTACKNKLPAPSSLSPGLHRQLHEAPYGRNLPQSVTGQPPAAALAPMGVPSRAKSNNITPTV